MKAQLIRVALCLRTEWMSRTYTTDPPRLTPHDEWRLVVSLRGESPFRLVAFLCSPERASWGLRPGPSSDETEAAVHFFPRDWSTSEAVSVSFGYQGRTVVDHSLKTDPRPHVGVLAPETAVTGDVIRVCELPRHGITIAFLALATDDTENRRVSRWRVRPNLVSALPQGFDALASGHQHGIVDGAHADRLLSDAPKALV